MNHKFSFLHARLRTATLRNDAEGQAVLINCLLRNYLHYHLYDQADKLVSKSIFPELASNNEWARHFYYLGRIKAIQLEYSAANKHLLQAIRKAPQHTAVGFKQTVCIFDKFFYESAHCVSFRCKNWRL
jgi:26S proteasome regulatory subunit N3